MYVNEGVTGPSDEVEDRCERICTELSLLLSFDGPALDGVWKIPISPAGEEGASKAEVMIWKGFEGEGDEVSEGSEAVFEELDPKVFQDGEPKSRSANEEKDKNDEEESRCEVGSRRVEEGPNIASIVGGGRCWRVRRD